MSSNRFEALAKTRANDKKTVASTESKRRSYLLSISDDFSGTNTKNVLSAKEAKICSEFLNYASKKDFAGSSKLSLVRLRARRPLNSSEVEIGAWKPRRVSGFINGRKWLTLWHGRGYPIGLLLEHSVPFPNRSDGVITFLCTDGRLRCERLSKPFAPKATYAFGVGSLPESKHMPAQLLIGQFHITESEASTPSFVPSGLDDLLSRYVE